MLYLCFTFDSGRWALESNIWGNHSHVPIPDLLIQCAVHCPEATSTCQPSLCTYPTHHNDTHFDTEIIISCRIFYFHYIPNYSLKASNDYFDDYHENSAVTVCSKDPFFSVYWNINWMKTSYFSHWCLLLFSQLSLFHNLKGIKILSDELEAGSIITKLAHETKMSQATRTSGSGRSSAAVQGIMIAIIN